MKLRGFIVLMITAIVLSSVAVISADGVTKRIRFARGKNFAIVSGAVVRGERDTYIVRAKAEQMMNVKITSLEDNAVFQIQGPDGEYLQDAGEEDDAKMVTNTLPYDGEYKIIVGGTRGNASYKLTVKITNN